MSKSYPSVLELYTPEQAILMERIKQDSKFKGQEHSDKDWFLILAEEFGEISNALTIAYVEPVNSDLVNPALQNMEYEIVQVAAVALAWLEQLHKGI